MLPASHDPSSGGAFDQISAFDGGLGASLDEHHARLVESRFNPRSSAGVQVKTPCRQPHGVVAPNDESKPGRRITVLGPRDRPANLFADVVDP